MPNTEEIADELTFSQELKKSLGQEFMGVFTQKYFDDEGHAELTEQLENVLTMVQTIVRTHDKLADDTGNSDCRINGKRGRKAEDKKVPTTIEDVLKAF